MSNLLKSAMKIGLGVILAQAILALSVPFLTRLYNSEQFALYGYLFSVSSVLVPFTFGKLESFAPRYTPSSLAKRFIPGLLYFSQFTFFIVLILSCVIIFSFPPKQIDTVTGKLLTATLVTIATFAISIFNVLALLASKLQKYKILGLSRIKKSVIVVTLQLVASSLQNQLSLFFSEVVGRIYACFSLKLLSVNITRSKSSFLFFFYRNINEMKYTWGAAVINSAALNLFPILLVSLYAGKLSGTFFVLYKMIGAPINILTQSLALSYLGGLGDKVRKKEFREILDAVKQTSLIVALITTIIFGVGYLLIFYYWDFIFGLEWDMMPVLYVLLLPVLFGQVVFSPFSQIIILLGGSKIQLIWDVFRLVLVVASLVVPSIFLKQNEVASFMLSIKLFSLSMFVMYLVHFLLTLNYLKRKEGE